MRLVILGIGASENNRDISISQTIGMQR